ncbi:uncharacterized protein LOC116732395 [Xiphophorus hellerii]|uniref:uncharacterized protein LOC116732395 n=1 Tax=Xiphophorus hellerii TaxID=8084 RepID=UPI0013B4678A|nr:uncharacterized protein LOC116732395 [Xiphophorus hellerii]
MGRIYQVRVHGLRGEKFTIDLGNTEEQMQRFTVGQLKEKIFEMLPYIAGDENLRMIFTDKNLEGDTSLLSEYGVQHMSVIQVVIKVPGGGGPLPPNPHTDDGLTAAKDLQHQRMGKIYQVVVSGFRGEKIAINLCNTEEQMQRLTVGQLKEKIVEKFPDIAAEREYPHLFFTDKVLEGDTSLLSEYGVQHMSVIQLIRKVPGGGEGPLPPNPHTDDGLGDKEGETRRSKECLNIPMSKTQNKFSVGPK